jgi:lysozyme
MPNGLNAVVDISHHNGITIDFKGLKVAGVIGVIHKATRGPHGRRPNL